MNGYFRIMQIASGVKNIIHGKLKKKGILHLLKKQKSESLLLLQISLIENQDIFIVRSVLDNITKSNYFLSSINQM